MTEIVEPGRSGWLVAPDDAADLSAQLERIVRDPAAWARFPEAARARYEALFDERAAATGVTEMMAARLARSKRAATGRALAQVDSR